MKLYDELASWWPLFSAPEEYAEEAIFYRDTRITHCDPSPMTLLEPGSGGGNTASHLKARFRLTLVDLSPQMLAVSRALNPECEHILGDMRSVRLGRVFDAVFIHDAVMCMSTPEDLRRAIETAFYHCRIGGAASFVPDSTRETFKPSTDHGGRDGARGGIRYLEWMIDPDPDDHRYDVHYAMIIRENGKPVRYEHDYHSLGLFSRGEWIFIMSDVGFKPKVLCDAEGRDIFVGVR
ncbi:MAG: trans-aconitate 2-methyltransferase [Acidobacteriota bacterium]